MQLKWVFFVILVIILLAVTYVAYLFLSGGMKPRIYPAPSPVVTAEPVSSASPGLTATPGAAEAESSCNSDSDCKQSESCKVVGPIIANQPLKKVCVPEDQVVPF